MKKVLSAHSQFQMYQDAVLIISKTTLVQFVRKETGEPSAPQEHADRLSSRLAASRSASTRSAVKSKVASFAASTTSSRSKGASMPKTRVTSSNTKKAPATQLKKTTQDAQIQQMDRLWKECMSVLFNRGSLLQIPETVKHMVEWAFARIGIFQRPLVNQTANEIFDSDNLVSFLGKQRQRSYQTQTGFLKRMPSHMLMYRGCKMDEIDRFAYPQSTIIFLEAIAQRFIR